MKYLKYFESFMVTEVPTNEKEFLDLAKRLDPDRYSIYYTLLKNKGMEAAMKKLMSSADSIKNDVRLRRADKKREKLIKQKENNFGLLSKDDIRFYVPYKKDAKELFSKYILEDSLKDLYKSYGLKRIGFEEIGNNNFILSSDNNNFEVDNNIKTYNGSLDVNLWSSDTSDFYLGNIVSIIENEFELSNDQDDAIKILNVSKYEDMQVLREQFQIRQHFSVSSLIKVDSLYKTSLSVENKVGFEYSIIDNAKEGLGKTFYIIEEEHEEKSNDTLEPALSDNCMRCLNNIKNKYQNSFIVLNNKIKKGKSKSDKKFKEFISYLVGISVEILHMEHNREHVYKNINLISKYFPKAYKLIEPHFSSEGIDKADKMGEMGF